jgi:hypothetical protein
MKLLRAPLVIVGLLLTAIGFGNVYTGRTKTAEYEQLLSTHTVESEPERRPQATKLEPHLRTTLLKSLSGRRDVFSVARAKLDFYRVVYSGGRLLMLLGTFCAIAGIIHFWYRETRTTPSLASQ